MKSHDYLTTLIYLTVMVISLSALSRVPFGIDHTFDQPSNVEVFKDRRIQSIDLFVHDKFSTQLYRRMKYYENKKLSEKNFSKIQEDIRSFLKAQGYPKSLIFFKTKRMQKNSVKLIINVDLNSPCHIKKIFTIEKFSDFTIQEGDLCSSFLLSKKLDAFERDSKKRGFLKASFKIEKIDYQNNFKEADLYISGKLGPKIEYKIYDISRFSLFENLISNAYLKEIDLSLPPSSMKNNIDNAYKIKGFLDTKIEGPFIIEDDGIHIYTYRVNPGRQYTVNSIVIEGNNDLKREEIFSAIDKLKDWQNNEVFKASELNDVLDKLAALYNRYGYWNAEIYSPKISKDRKTNSIRIIITLKEGQKRILHNVRLKGNQFFKTFELMEYFPLKKRDPLNNEELFAFEDKLKEKYTNQGFLYFELKKTFKNFYSADNIQSELEYTIHEGLRAKIGQINIVGLELTHKDVIRRELLFEEGDWYSPLAISRTRTALINLGIFKQVKIDASHEAKKDEKADILNLNIELRESDAGRVLFGPGFDLRRGLNYTFQISHNNITGYGRRLSLRTSISEEKNQNSITNEDDLRGRMFLGRKLSVGFIEPYVFHSPLNAGVSFLHSGVADEIWKLSNSFELVLQYPFRTLINSFIGTFYNLKSSKDEGSTFQDSVLVTTGKSQIGSIGLRGRLDYRNNISWPSSGFLLHAETALARYQLLGNYKFFKWHTSISGYYNLFDQLVLASKFSLTSYENVERRSSDLPSILPSSERLHAEGHDRVRGFREALGPYVRVGEDRKEILGGTKRFLWKFELRRQFIQNVLAGSLFLDIGNAFISEQEENEFHGYFQKNKDIPTIEDNFRYGFKELINPKTILDNNYFAYGFSINFLTPLGPLNLAFAWPWKEPKSQRCKEEGVCFIRGSQNDLYLRRFKMELNIGSEF